MVQGLRLRVPDAGGPGSTLRQETRSHMPQLRAPVPQLKFCVLWLRPSADCGEVAQMVNNLPVMQGTQVRSLGREDPPGARNGMFFCSILACRRIPWTEESGGLQSRGLQRVGQD